MTNLATTIIACTPSSHASWEHALEPTSLQQSRFAARRGRQLPECRGACPVLPYECLPMILEVAPLQIRAGQAEEFEAAFLQAQRIISAMPGYLSHELRRCIERPCEYILLVRWQSLEAHEIGFRGSLEYQEWKQRLHHFYEPFPTVSHYEVVQGADGG
jgi:heme-degrading monooxygenase HmoA